MGLVVRLMGDTCFELDGQRVRFALRKAELIALYAALKGRVPRENLMSLFWPDKTSAQALANLRNALHLIKQSLPDNVQTDRRYFSLRDFSCDIATLSCVANPICPLLENIFYEPLGGVGLPECGEFEDWLFLERKAIRGKAAEYLRTRISNCYEKNFLGELCDSLEALIRIEPLDEDSVMELMEAYCRTGQRAKAVSAYNAYACALETGVGLQPSERCRIYLGKITRMEPPTERTPRFWCRRDEFARILSAMESRENTAVLLHGPAGIGKTALIDRAAAALSEGNTLVLSARAHQEAYPYSSWNSIMAKAGRAIESSQSTSSHAASVLSGIFPGFIKGGQRNYNADVAMMTKLGPVAISEMIEDILSETNRRIVMIFEDIHWFDAHSLKLLETFMSTVSMPLHIIVSGRQEPPRSMYNPAWKTVRMEIKPFAGDEIAHICTHFLPGEVIQRRGLDFFIKESEGIPLLLFEMLRVLEENPAWECASGLGNLIISRIGHLSRFQQNVLSCMSVLAEGAEAAHVAQITGETRDAVVAALEELAAKGLIRERVEESRAVWEFTHVKVRECIYEAISVSGRQELHRHAASVLSAHFSPQRWDPALSAMLRRHYVKSGQKAPELKQHIRELIFDITLNHDFFPVVPDSILLSCSAPFSTRADTEGRIGQVMALLEEISTRQDTGKEELASLEASCFELAGGYHISWGDYGKGQMYIDESSRLARKFGFTETLVHCLKQRCYMYIQLEKPDRLISTAQELMHLAEAMPHYRATAVRFVGMGRFMQGDADISERTLRHSVALFERLQLRGRSNTLGILVGRCYIGEIYHSRGDFKTAMEHLEYCTDTCRRINLYWGRSYFHALSANTALDMGDRATFYRHIDEGVSLFESCQGGRCGSILYSLKAVADAERGDKKSAAAAMGKAEILLQSVERAKWTAAHNMAKSRLR